MAGQQRRSGDLNQQKAQRTGLRQRTVQEGERGRDCRRRKIIFQHRWRTQRCHSPKHNAKIARGYGSISTKKPRATHLFSSSLPRNKPAMTHQTPHAHATRCARSDFNLFLLCTPFAVQLQTYSKLHFTCGTSANDAQNEKKFVAVSANTTRHHAPPSVQQLALTSRRHT